MLSSETVPNNRKVNQATCLEFAKDIINLSKALGPGAGGQIIGLGAGEQINLIANFFKFLKKTFYSQPEKFQEMFN